MNKDDNSEPARIDQRVTSHNQFGGITAHTVNVAPQARRLHSPQGEALKRQLLAEAPRDRRINITVVFGDPEAYAFGQEIFDFLKVNGFDVWGMDQATYVAPQVGLKVDPSGELWEMIVGHAVRA
jgi:hypothetical protein